MPEGREIMLELLEAWGDPCYIGLTGLEVIGESGEPLRLSPDCIRVVGECAGEGAVEGAGVGGTPGGVHRLLDGANRTLDEAHMWLAPAARQPEDCHGDRPTRLQSLVVWNYNGAVDGTDSGAMRVRLSLDGQRLSPPGGTLLRKGPATDAFPYGQAIRLSTRPPHPEATEKQVANLPTQTTPIWKIGIC
ncbi:unnamed protein product [Ostreobium quekettii]|uniref:KATNIP domain-containing protein n=1 Tax=Ostreobium quekettii TaxID=121088 RepID=A0A8S1J3X6_9CHLO|nr:unnamed protein product [Ostreobium quekettii]